MKMLTCVACVALFASPAFANSFTNGGFEVLSNGAGQLNYNTVAAGWDVKNHDGYNFVFAPSAVDTHGSVGQYGSLTMWGPNNGAPNGLPAASPSGGNFVALDGAFQLEPLQQAITGLTVGKIYSVGFDYAFAQQAGFDGATIQHISLSFAGATQTSADYHLTNHGFSGWMHTSYDFVATSATDTLSFLAYGNLPVPPFALLDGVTFTPDTVPEPATWAMLLTGFSAVGFAARRRRRVTVAA